MSAEGWVPTTLGAEAQLLVGYPFKSSEYSDDPLDIRLLRGDNVGQGRLRWNGAKRWPRDQVNDFTDYLLGQDDVILAMDRPWIEAGLKFAHVTSGDLPALLVQRVARLRGNHSLDTTFLRYLVRSEAFTRHVLGVQTGTTVPHISARQIREFRFHRPPISEQERIARTLGVLDDKIDVNRQIGETLEEIARALFQSWFVDFDPVRGTATVPEDIRRLFPDRLVDSPIGLVPEGWEVAPLSSLITVSRDAIDPRGYPDEFFDHFSLPAYDVGRGPAVERGAQIKSIKLAVPDGCVLLSKLNPRIPRVWWPAAPRSNRRIASTEFVVALPRQAASRTYLFNLFTSSPFRGTVSALVRGTSGSHQRVSVVDLLNVGVVLPPAELVKRFDVIAVPMFTQKEALLAESKTLADLRDTLLPKLISGEVQVKTP